MPQSLIEDTRMAKKTASRGRAKTAKKAAPKAKKVRRIAKATNKAKKPMRAKAVKAAPKVAKARNQVQIKDELREKFVMEQGNTTFEDYFSSGSEHFGL